MNKISIVQEIVTGISEFKIIPFLGAGMSKPCGAMDWTEIIETLKIELHDILNDTNNLVVAQKYEDAFGRPALIEKLKVFCELKNIDSHTLQNHLKILAMNPPLIYTTNYDTAIETAAGLLAKDYRRIVGLKDIVNTPHGAKQIIKFHGDFTDDASIVFTRRDYDTRLQLERHPLDVLFRGHILGKSVLFLGYGFGDENIKLIFEMHKRFYGTENLPKSYIVSFEYNEIKEAELREHNVITLYLSSVEEFIALIDEINTTVLNTTIDGQFDELIKPLPNEVLFNFELENLKKYIASENHSVKQKSDKIRRTFELKQIPQDVEANVRDFFEDIIRGDYDDALKGSILLSFKYTGFKQIQNVIGVCFDILHLGENPKFIFSLANVTIVDVLMVVEGKLIDIFPEANDIRKWVCALILGYLEGMISENKKLEDTQVERYLSELNTQGYNELGDLGSGFTPKVISETIEYYLGNNTRLRTSFATKGFRRRKADIFHQLMNNMPKNI